jgi:cytochrome c556
MGNCSTKWFHDAGRAAQAGDWMRRGFGGVLALGLVAWLPLESSAAPPVKRARPPEFNKSITDAFFPDAREKLVGTRPQRSAAPVKNGTVRPVKSPDEAEHGNPEQGWKKLVTAEVVEDEIKAQQIKLDAAVGNATRFKGGEYQRARLHLSMLAALFAIAAEYDEPIRWKREAPAVRDLMARAGFNCKVGTDASLKDARARADDLQNLVRGSSLKLPAPTAEPAWPKIADRAQLMKRLEQAQQHGLAPWTANSGEFSKNAERLSHEAQLVAALAEIIGREGYEYADDETFREFARALGTQATVVREAVERKDYEQARKAVGEISKSCNNCHEGFRS